MSEDTFKLLLCAGIIVIFIIIGLIAYFVRKSKSKDTFVTTSQGGYIDKTTGSIKGPGLMTNGMRKRSWEDMILELQEKGYTNDGTQAMGATEGNGFSALYQNQQDIDAIDRRVADGIFSLEDLSTISEKIASGQNNASNNLYTRGGALPTKLIIAPNEVRCVIDEKYLPDRDKNRQIATVSAIIDYPGYDVNTERLGTNLAEVHFGTISTNKKHKRIVTAAGATGGGRVDAGKQIDLDEEASANKKAVEENIGIQGDKVVIVKDVDSEGNKNIVTTKLDSTPPDAEKFRKTYASGNLKVN